MSQVVYGLVLGGTCLLVWGLFRLLDLLIHWLVSTVWLILEKRQKRVDVNKKRLS
ncbi:hypothetical protein [Enterococcus sp. 5B3_DIV0040]|uniref:hypothetical protein n=1 Tax=Enterococcus sp. 5B3_DIV0040 TaxID=1834182 RepID=UPI000B6FF0B2|nr:hypothetical protein [Enterococcus sp. 5B3_DIV0040]OTO02219.1 hypothetical protein A5883_003046 [Enterococcus sp. 5B3_DIV0040]